ncbi:MAG TPA: hypothetical protein VMS60_11960 [Solirubrobacterales bacterium]|nr:hypothetical protein [Solirubrobacterales bacterium]
MSRQLVFIHGRAQQQKDPAALKRSWIEAWSKGLAKSGLSLPIDETAIHFPYYGDTLASLVDGRPAPDVIVRGDDAPPEERQFVAAVLEEARAQRGITDDQVLAVADAEVVERGPQNWHWVRAIVKALDEHLSGASGAVLAAVTFDVYHYLRNPGVRDAIEVGVRAAIPDDAEAVVVGHSLGTVVGYNLLRREGASRGWKVPLYLTLGSPLAVTAIRKALQPLTSPTCVDDWLNAIDPDDIVALYPLQPPQFGLQPAIENKTDVDNHTTNQHGIAGYLDDPVVASRIYEALMAS